MSLAKEFRVGIAARPLAFNQDIKALVSKSDLDALYLFHAVDAQRNSIRDSAGDSSHGTKKLPTPVLASVPILVPATVMQAMFREVVGAMHHQWDVLDNQNLRLQQARDLLLPRLMNGEIPV
jgi:type I restriction enzyme S subunit